MSNELVVIENVELIPFFTRGESLDSVLEQIEKEAMSFAPGDLSVKKNRDAVKAIVTKVTKSKTYLESHGKELAAEYKEIPKRIDANRKKTKDFLTELQAKVRQPLTEWEEEDKRIKAEEAARIEAEKVAIEIERDHELALLMSAEFDRVVAERVAEELRIEKERQEKLERQRIEREEQLKRESAEKARREAEEKAKAERERVEREKREAIEREEEAKAEAERQRKAAIQAEIDLENEREAAAKLAEENRLARVEADAKAKRDAEEAAERARLAEIERQRKIKADEDAAKAQREANTRHVTAKKKELKLAIVALGINEADAIKVVKAMASNQLPNCQINY